MIIFQPANRSIINHIDPRLRVIVAIVFAVTLCICDKPQSAGIALGMSIVFAFVARVSLVRLLRNLKHLNIFMLLLLITLPISIRGDSLFSFAGISWCKSGVVRVGMIAIRSNGIMIALVALLATMPPAHLGFALQKLGSGKKLPHILLFMVRYIEVIHQEYHRLRDALRLRNFRPGFNRHTFRTFGNLTGLLLVRSIDRSERISKAMLCRGFRGKFYVLSPFKLTYFDCLFALLILACILLIYWLEWS